MTFADVEIGQVFRFDFDFVNGSEYTYKKVGDNSVECVSCPKTEDCAGKVYQFRRSDCKVDIISL